MLSVAERLAAMNAEKYIEFTSAIRGYHIYKRHRQPEEAERLESLRCLCNQDSKFGYGYHRSLATRNITCDQVFAGQRSRCLRRINTDTLSKITNNARWSGNTVQNYCKTS